MLDRVSSDSQLEGGGFAIYQETFEGEMPGGGGRRK